MAEAAAQEKTEKATPRRRQDARKKGQVAQSKEIVRPIVAQRTRQPAVFVTRVKDVEHVVDQVIDVEVLLDGLVLFIGR